MPYEVAADALGVKHTPATITSQHQARVTSSPSAAHAARARAHSLGSAAWLLRMLRLRPARRVIALVTTKPRTLRVLHRLLLEWRRWGIAGIAVDGRAGRIEARVAPANVLRARPVAFALDVFALDQRDAAGRAAKRAVLEVAQLAGSRATFERLARALADVLRKKGMVMVDKTLAKAMKETFARWDGS